VRAHEGKSLLLMLLLFCLGHSTAQLPPLPAETPPCVEPEFKGPDNMVLPKYPKDALQARTDTVVVLRAVVDADGRTQELTGPPATNDFARASLSAVRRWRFHPVFMEGTPVETVFKVHIHFNSTLLEVIPRLEVESPQPPIPSLDQVDPLQGPVYRSDDPGVVLPKPIYSPVPEYTEKDQRMTETGSATVAVIVGTDGVPRNIKTICSSIPDLNQQAIDTFSLWRFEPGTKDGQPAAVRIVISTSFHLY
jgi:TonB family protein